MFCIRFKDSLAPFQKIYDSNKLQKAEIEEAMENLMQTENYHIEMYDNLTKVSMGLEEEEKKVAKILDEKVINSKYVEAEFEEEDWS